MTKEEIYNRIKKYHPDWSEEQIWTQVSVELNAEDVISQNPEIRPSEELFRLILEKAKEWLFEILPDIFEKVANYFVDLLDRLPEWAVNGLEYVYEFIKNYIKFETRYFDYDY